MTTFDGACHCGAAVARFTTAMTAETIPLRACGCRFCRLHGGFNASDPHGEAVIFADEGSLRTYRFGARVTDFLLCATCGTYVAAAMTDGGEMFATLNMRIVDDDALNARGAEPMNYDAESGADKIARRRKVWTPARVRPRAEAAA